MTIGQGFAPLPELAGIPLRPGTAHGGPSPEPVEPLDWAVTGREIYDDLRDPVSYAGLLPAVPGNLGHLVRGPAARAAGELYEVGAAAGLRKLPLPGSEVHHVPQSRQAESLVGGFRPQYRARAEIGIRLPESEHAAITAAQRELSAPASARDMLARDMRLLRRHSTAPRAKLREVIDENYRLHEEDYLPLHRERSDKHVISGPP